MSWTEASIESLCLAVTSGGTPSRARSEYWENGTIPWLKTGELNDGIVQDAEEKITKEGLANSSAKIFPKNTVLMAMYGDGRTITTLSILGRESATNQACAAMIANPEVCDYRFLFQALKLHRHKLLSLVVAGAQRNLSLGIVKRFAFPVPDLPTQQRIAGILSAYDDLIENNRRRIGLLEQAARLLYREWFVHLRFPERETAKIVDGLPEGWSRCAVEDLLLLQRGFDLPVGDRKEGDVPVYGSTGIVGYHNEPKVPAPAIITGRSGSLGQVAISDTPCWPLNTALWVKELKDIPATLGYFLLVSLELEKYNGGASVPTLDRKVVHRLPAVRPSSDVADQFDAIASKSFQTIAKLKTHNLKLTRARDLLLPRLMDGRIPV